MSLEPILEAKASDASRVTTILRVDSSARQATSFGRDVTDRVIDRILELYPGGRVIGRDLAEAPPPPVDNAWVDANNTPEEDRTAEQHAALAFSDVLVGELEEADLVVIGLPVYNFSVPATLKAWIDQVCRARRTFAFSEEGPVGLLKGKRAIVVYVSGGTPFGSEIDYASGYMKHILGFIGISDVTFVKVERLMFDPDAINRAKEDAGKLADPFLSASSA